jgi:hypothetical protein
MEEEVALRRLEVMAAGIGYCPLLDRRPELSERRLLWEYPGMGSDSDQGDCDRPPPPV